MTVTHTSRSVAILLVVWLGVAASGRAAQEGLAHAKQLYASAAYDEALAALDLLESNESPNAATEVREYRVFCLLALDRNDDARRAIEALVTANPLYRPSEAQASPHIRAAIQDVKRRLLPQIAQSSYVEAKAAFDRKDLREAAAGFDRVIAILDDEDAKAVPNLADLRTLAVGFRDFSKAAAPAVAATSQGAAAAAAAPPPSPTPPPSVAPPVSLPQARPIYTQGDPMVVPPVVMSQKMPGFSPIRAPEAPEYVGTIELLIDEVGNVESASMSKPIYPAYDPVLMKAARGWKYIPATKNGVPVKFRRFVEVHLRSTAPGNADDDEVKVRYYK